MTDGNYSISQAAHVSGVTVKAIRYYEEIGLLDPQTRSEGNYRLYSEADLVRLERICRIKNTLGLTLADQEQPAPIEIATSRLPLLLLNERLAGKTAALQLLALPRSRRHAPRPNVKAKSCVDVFVVLIAYLGGAAIFALHLKDKLLHEFEEIQLALEGETILAQAHTSIFHAIGAHPKSDRCAA